MKIPVTHQLPNHAFEDKRYGYAKFIVLADGTGTAHLKLSNGKHLAGMLKAGVTIGFFDDNGSEKARVTLKAEVSDLFPGASTKEKDVSAKFSLSVNEWETVSRVGHAYFLDYKPEDFVGMTSPMWTIYTF